ncbi:MAG: peroxidase family protein, partial [Proteobacteria bacterium]|nr:peroxidase family protein [Pseudomonadota bacterium]
MLPSGQPDIDLSDPTSYRSIDDTGNNLANTNFGAAGTSLLRLFNADYIDGSTPSGQDRPNPRDISNAIGQQGTNQPSDRGLTALFWGWGQVLAHDITMVGTGDEAFNIPVAADDFVGIIDEIPLNRSEYEDGTGSSAGNPRQQVNSITHFIDASFVYGSDAETAGILRRDDGTGQLWEGPNRLLPTNGQLGVDSDPSNDYLFVAGDARANEQLALTAFHTIFLREHNRLAAHIAETNPGWSDELIYQTTRALVAAEVQAITYNEFLPILIGSQVGLDPYEGYDPTIDPSISNTFATAAFRMGHTLLQNYFLIVSPEPGETLPLAECFFNPACIQAAGIDATILGMGGQDAQVFDTSFVNAVRNQLITGPGITMGVDLPALNIQRGRDHGLPSYNDVRADLIQRGWIEGTGSVSQAVLDAYDGADLDLFIAGLSEQPFGDALVGEVFHAILSEQFFRLRAGDRFWYQNPGLLDPDLVAWLDDLTLTDIILWNTDLVFFQQFAFFAVDFGVPRAQTINQLSVALYLDGMTVNGLDDYDLYEVGVQISAGIDSPFALNQLHGEWFNAFTEAGFSATRSALRQLD